jgi:hypothetical protein
MHVGIFDPDERQILLLSMFFWWEVFLGLRYPHIRLYGHHFLLSFENYMPWPSICGLVGLESNWNRAKERADSFDRFSTTIPKV